MSPQHLLSSGCPQDGLAPTHLAATLGLIQVLRALLQLGADKDLRDRNGFAALHHCCMVCGDMSGKLACLELLISCRAEVEVVDKVRWSLHGCSCRTYNA